MCQGGVEQPPEEASMGQASTIGLDIAKWVFQAHGADATGRVVFRKRLVRAKVLEFFAGQPPCLVALEACGGAHYWARELGKLGHTVRLIPPAYVKPFVKRQKNDVADAEAICEAAQRPGMRFVPVKDEAQQANTVVFRARDLLVRQRTQCINALRGHLAEYGHVVPQGPAHVDSLVALVEDPKSSVPESARGILQVLIRTLNALEEQLKELEGEIARCAKADPVARRLMTIPGIGPIAATAITALVPAPEGCRAGRDFAAWLGLTLLQLSNEEWTSKTDPEAKIAKLKDGRTHLAYKPEHAVDLDTGVIVAARLHPTDHGDTTTIADTLAAAQNNLAQVSAGPTKQQPSELVTDKGYHSRAILKDLDGGVWKTRIAEPKQPGFSRWHGDDKARAAVYANRTRLGSGVGKQAMRLRAEIVERSFAHNLDRGGMRRTWLRGRENVHKRYLIHTAGHNLGILMRLLIGAGTPREAAARALAYLLFVHTEQTAAIILIAVSPDGFAILVTAVTADPG